jgi:hypothetical protein
VVKTERADQFGAVTVTYGVWELDGPMEVVGRAKAVAENAAARRNERDRFRMEKDHTFSSHHGVPTTGA